MEGRVRANPEQLSMLLEYLEMNGDIFKRQSLEDRSRAEYLWIECTNIINSVKGGVHKTTEKWKKVWADIKSKTKRKALKIMSVARKGGTSQQVLTDFEQRVLAIAAVNEQTAKEIETGEPFSFASLDYSTALQDSITEGNDIVFLKVRNDLRHSSPQSAASPDPATPPPASPQPSPPPPAASPAASPAPTRSRARPSAASYRRRVRVRYRPSPYERAAREFASLEYRRLELEEARDRMQHERGMRALDLEQERVKLFSTLVDIAQACFECYRSKNMSSN